MSYNIKANFYPAKEPKNGYVGIADVTIANAIRIRGIAVFEKEGQHHIQFPGYGEGDNRGSYVIPASKEAHAAFLDVIEKAVADPEKHFGWTAGKMNPRLEVSGVAVNEPYADGRFNIEVEGLCSLRGITTRPVNYQKDGKDASFISVDMPTLPPYEKENGEKVYPAVFEGLESKYEKDGEPKSKDFGDLINGLVLAKRKELLERHPSLEEQVKNAEQKAQANTGKEGPAPEQTR